MGVYLPAARLPSTYQEVEYIQSSGTQYINTGVYPNPDYTIEMKFEITSSVRYNTFFGTRTNGKQRFIGRTENVRDGVFFIQRSTGVNDTTTYGYEYWEGAFSTNTIYTIKMNKELYMDGILKKTFSNSTSSTLYNNPVYLFALSTDGAAGDYFYGKVYYCKLWDDSNNLIRDFIPCYRKSDNVIGMYDIVNNQFYTNSGTGTFSKGADVTAMPLKNAYIGGYYEYSYDFSNKSVALMQADGWTFSSTSNWSFSSNGIDCSSQQRAFLTLDVLSEAKKITIENVYVVSTTSRSRGVRFCLSTSELGNPAGHYWSGGEGVTRIDIPSYAKSISSYSGTGTKTCKVVLDLENKTGLLTYTGLSEISQTFNETSANIIRTYKTLQLFFSGGTGAEVKTVKVTVEK